MRDKPDILTILQRFRKERGIDEQINLYALQTVGIAEGDKRVLRVWFNDGRIREMDCSALVAGPFSTTSS